MTKRRLHLPLALTMVLTLGFTSCIGPFNATSRLHTWNREIENPWAAEAVYLPLRVLFVYPAFFVGDVLIFNSIEF
jgi:hypothetical protein